MLKAWFKKYQLKFKNPVLTSRGGMSVKNGYYLFISDETHTGVGECSFIEGLSIDPLDRYEQILQQLCDYIFTKDRNNLPDLAQFPSIRFGWETAVKDLQNGGSKILFESDFTRGKKAIPINGLVWMGEKEFMKQQIQSKLRDGFKCIKIKVGAIDFEDEIKLLAFIREQFSADRIEIRLDANGAFSTDDVLKKLEALSKFHIHSIEQPIKAGQIDWMKKVCAASPIPVALDEELIKPDVSKEELLDRIHPAYIILKPSLLGGFTACEEWIMVANKYKTDWWATSALESNIGLNAIAQWVFTQDSERVQGLGTGGLYTENITSPLYIEYGHLHYSTKQLWSEV